MKSEDLFEILVRQHSDMLTAYLRGLAFDETLVDDAFQETLLAAWNQIEQFDRERPFGPWLRGIARNVLLSMARGKKRYRAHLTDLMEKRMAEQLERMESEPGDTFAEQMRTLRDCIARLGDEHRHAVDLVYVRGLDAKQAAEASGLADETFRKRLYRARLALAECLRNKGLFSEAAA